MENMTDMELKQAALITKLSDREKFCLNAFFKGENKNMAFICSRKSKLKNESGDSFNQMVSKWMNSTPVKAYLHKLETEADARIKAKEDAKEDEESEMTKEELIKFFTKKVRSKDIDDKTQMDAGNRLADLLAWKKEKIEEKAEQRHYYSPLKCSTCKTLLSVTNCANCIHTFTNKNPNTK